MKANPGKILVTGACGFVGSNMVDLLLEEGLEVRATDRPRADHSRLDESGVEFYPADLSDRGGLEKACRDIDAIFHTASLYDLMAPPEKLQKVNVEGTRNLCEAAAGAGVRRLVHWSTVAVYGKIPAGELPADEDTTALPDINYGASKIRQEEVVKSFSGEGGLEVTILRPAPIYGPRSVYGIAKTIFNIAQGKLPGIPGKGDVPFPMVHVRDVTGAALHLAGESSAAGETYLVVDESDYNVEEIILGLADILGQKVRRIHIPLFLARMALPFEEWRARRKGERPSLERDEIRMAANVYRFDISKLEGTGYRLLYPDSLAGLKETVEWYRREGVIP